MAYRPINTNMWKDDYIMELNPNEKLLFMYLLSNDFTTQSGIYNISLAHVAMETGLSNETILSGLQKFHADEKIIYNLPTKEIAIINWRKYNENKSYKTMTKVADELRTVKEPFLTLFLYDPRVPLARWTPKEKNGIQQEEQIVYNPMVYIFGDYTDEMILSTIKQFREGVSMGYRSGIDSPHYITEQKQNHNKLITKTKTDTPYEVPHIENALKHSVSDVDNWIKRSSIMNAFPTERRMRINIPDFNEVRTNLEMFSKDEVEEILENVESLFNSPDHTLFGLNHTMVAFLKNPGITMYLNESKPFDRFSNTSSNKVASYDEEDVVRKKLSELEARGR
jgi:hypothetical protein